MNPVLRFACIVLAATLSACGSLSPFEHADNVQIAKWIDRNQYGRAIQALERRPPTQANAAQLRQVRKRAHDYDRDAAAKVRHLADKGDWAAALEHVDRAIMNYPEGDQLRAARKALERRRAQKLKQLRIELLVARARWLVESTPVYERMARVDPDNPDHAWEAERHRRQAQKAGEELAQYGIDALSRRQLDRAELYLALAAKLAPSEPVTRARKRVATLQQQQVEHQAKQEQRARERAQKKQKQHVREEHRKQQRQHQERVEQLTKEVKTALEEADLRRARRALSDLKELGSGSQAAELQRRLDSAVASRVEVLVEQGNRLYTDGEVARAKQIWQQALELDPGNPDLQARVQRAERVLNNLEELQQRDAGNAGGD